MRQVAGAIGCCQSLNKKSASVAEMELGQGVSAFSFSPSPPLLYVFVPSCMCLFARARVCGVVLSLYVEGWVDACLRVSSVSIRA